MEYVNKQWFITLLICGCTLISYAQNFEDAFNAFARQNEQSFSRFTDSINRAFAEAMVTDIQAFKGERPKVRDPEPKPASIPGDKEQVPAYQVHPGFKPTHPEQTARLESAQPSIPDVQLPEPVHPSSPEPPAEQLNYTEFDLFGDNIRYIIMPFPERMKGIAPEDVSAFWIQLSECDYEPLLQLCRAARMDRDFNDWAIYQLVLEMARQAYPRQYNEQVVLAVFLLNQFGIEAKVGFGYAHLFCLLAVEQQLYGLSFADIAKNRYYLLEADPGDIDSEGSFSFRTYGTPFPKPTKALDMNVRVPLKSSYFPDIIDSAINISTNMIELFRTYPQVDISVYANAQPSDVFCRSVERVFKPYLQSLSTVEAVDFLLAYVQYGFEYAADNEQFGYEKPFFCEENFYYPQNDCEDRSVLFAFLVHHLLHLDVVLVDYPGHLAAAVHFDEDVIGSSLMYNGKRYVICDPSYIGAPIGLEMPDFGQGVRTVVPVGY